MLTSASYRRALKTLAARDRDLAEIVEAHGPPPMWSRDPGFPTLVQIILEQQVSLASARAAFEKLEATLGGVSPEGLSSLGPDELRQVGFSRQKARYCRALAEAVTAGRFDIGGLSTLSDDDARAALMSQTGIGAWTADIYLLMALRRPDVWPTGDLALAKAARTVKQLDSVPDQRQLEELSELWRPWRAVAARLLWHQYLSTR